MNEKSLSDKYKDWQEVEFNNTRPYLAFEHGYLLRGSELCPEIHRLKQKLDTYIQLAETKGKELEKLNEQVKEAREVIKKCMENTQESDTDNICREYLEKWK